MYNVLLADDEIYDLEGLKTFIPWSELDMHVIGAVNNGFEACKIIDSERVDILVTDVRMPNMSGLELAKKAMEKHQNLRIVFVSGYQDFNYVKTALSLNAYSYVLKPMNDNELIESLMKIRDDLNAEKKRHETEQVFKEMIPIARNEYLLRLLEGSFSEHTLDILNREYNMACCTWPGRVAVLETDDLWWKLNPYNQKEKNNLLTQFIENVIKVCREKNIENICKISKQRIALLIFDSMDHSEIQDIISQISDDLPFTITIGIGDPVYEPAEVQDSYVQALEALEYKMFYGKGRVITPQDVITAEMNEVKSLHIQLDSLLTAMTTYDLVRIHDVLDDLFKLTMAMQSKFTIHNFTMYLIMKLDGHLHSMNEDLFRLLGLELKNLDILLQFETIEDICSWLRRKVFQIAEALHFRKQGKNWKLIQEVVEHVKSRLHENITLRDVAEHFSFTPNYLGLMFKEEKGKSFSEYLITLRMEKAKELLRDSKLKIYEIAEQVGYRYLPYFSRQFKEAYGMTPIEYRRNH